MKNIQNENLLPQAVTSTNRFNICMDSLNARLSGEKKESDSLRFVFPFEYDEYAQLFEQSANIILKKKKRKSNFRY
jgi:hypothetical protein